MPAKNIIQLNQVTKKYPLGNMHFTALQEIDLQIPAGTFVAVLGKSGSGKSTLINILAGIDNATSGEVNVNGAPLHQMNEDDLAIWRRKNIGVVFQFFQLLPTLTVIENVLLAMDFCNVIPSNQREKRAVDLLDRFGIGLQARKLPVNLSGGEQQRAAMARALANDPPLILADEPTGNLDSHTADAVLQLFHDLSKTGKTVVMVTHERDIRSMVDQAITLEDGKIIQEGISYATALD